MESIPDSPMQTVRADDLVIGDTLTVPMTSDIETVTAITVLAAGAYVLVKTDGTGPNHGYMWPAEDDVTVVSRGGDAR